MRFKKPKEEVLREIRDRALNKTNAVSQNNATVSVNLASLTWNIQEAIASAVEEGFRTILENEYTDEDFERDLTLK